MLKILASQIYIPGGDARIGFEFAEVIAFFGWEHCLLIKILSYKMISTYHAYIIEVEIEY